MFNVTRTLLLKFLKLIGYFLSYGYLKAMSCRPLFATKSCNFLFEIFNLNAVKNKVFEISLWNLTEKQYIWDILVVMIDDFLHGLWTCILHYSDIKFNLYEIST